jgi:hypothetical protein
MRVYWWQAGLHLEPESKTERAALKQLGGFFSGLGFLGDPNDEHAGKPLADAREASHIVEPGPITDPRDKESVAGGVNKFPKVVR